MKVIKFRTNLVPLVLSGVKTSTWRLFDDKNLAEDDKIALQEFGADEHFAKAKITKVVERKFKDLSTEDRIGHEGYNDDIEMYRTYSGYYKTDVGPDTHLKIIRFELIK